MKKRENTRWVLLCGVLLCTFLLASCGLPADKSASDIAKDVMASDAFLSEYGLQIHSHSTHDREVHEKEKISEFIFDIHASNQDFKYEASYKIRYIAEDKNWALETCEKISDSYTALNSPVKDDAETVVKDQYDSLTYVDEAGEGNEYAFTYRGQKIENGITMDFDLSIPLTFEPGGWKVGKVQASEAGYSGSCGDGLSWALDTKGGLQITGSGNIADYSTEILAPWFGLKFPIKNIIVAEGVGYIGSCAFSPCEELTTVDLPNSLNGIGQHAFSGCTSLSEIHYAGSAARWKALFAVVVEPDTPVAKLRSAVSTTAIVDSGMCGEQVAWTLDESGLLTIAGAGPMKDYTPYGVGFSLADEEANASMVPPWSGIEGFDKYRATQIPVKQAVIENGVTSLGQGAFLCCDYLKSVTIPTSVTTIGTTAFGGCSILSDIVIPDGVTSMGNRVFDGCTLLNEVSLPASLTNIGENSYSEIETVKFAGSWTQWVAATGSEPPANVTVAINDKPAAPPIEEPDDPAVLSIEEAYQIAENRFAQIAAEQGWPSNFTLVYAGVPSDEDGILHYYFSMNRFGLNGMPAQSIANLKVNAYTGECYDIFF